MFDLIKGALKGIAAQEGYFLSNIEIASILTIIVILIVVLFQLVTVIFFYSNINQKFRRVYRRQTKIHECINNKFTRLLEREIEDLKAEKRNAKGTRRRNT